MLTFDPVKHLPKYTSAYVVGKGPSLDYLRRSLFTDTRAPVVAINEAIHAVEKLNLPNPVFCFQQDGSLFSSCRPKNGTWVLSTQAWVRGKGDTYPKAIKYTPQELDSTPGSLTGLVALRALSRAGYTKATMVAFDAHFGKELGYAKVIGHTHIKAKRADDRFIKNDQVMEEEGVKLGIELEWIKPVQPWNIVTVCVKGGIYHKGHVDALKALFKKHCRNPHSFFVLGDEPWANYQVSSGWKGWFSKVEIFQPLKFPNCTPVLYVDLDTFPCRDFMLPHASDIEPGKIYANVDGWRPSLHQTSIMAFHPNTVTKPFTWLKANPKCGLKGDEEIVSKAMGDGFCDLDLIVKARSYKIDKPTKEDADIIYFHGNPKPWDPELNWMKVEGPILKWSPTGAIL